MKKLVSFALTALLLLSTGTAALAAPVRLPSADAQAQTSLIFSHFDTLRQDESSKPWFYAVTDLDRNGRLELLAASEHDVSRTTTLAAWEVSADGTALVACPADIQEGESFPDIVSDNADCFYDAGADTWNYLFYDNIILSEQEAYAVKCSVNLTDGVFSYRQYALEHVVTDGDRQTVEFLDLTGGAISLDQYNAAGVNAFAGKERSGANLDWFSAAEASAERLADSYAVFNGEKQPAKSTRDGGSGSGGNFMTITKDPTNESHSEGDTAWFVSGADVWNYLTWTFVAPGGAECSAADFAARFPNCTVGGAGGTVLSIAGVTRDMDGYGVYCTFRYKGQTARTSTAWLYVSATPAPVPTKKMSGTVTEAMMSTLTIYLDNGRTVQPLWDICSVDGNFEIGCRCDVYYQGTAPSNGNLTYVYIYGTQPEPSYGTMDGFIADGTTNYVTIDLGYGGTLYISRDLVNVVWGDLSIGAACTVYYYGEYPTDNNVYQVDVYGGEPEPSYGTMDGFVADGTTNYVTVTLDSGDSVYVGRELVNVVWGDLSIGAGCTVYYYGDYPTSDNVYQVDVYGTEPIVYDEPDTGDGDYAGGFDPGLAPGLDESSIWLPELEIS